MRKTDNSRPGSGKGRSFKKDSGKTDRKPASSRPYGDKPKKRDDQGFAGRSERPGDAEKKPRRSFGDSERDGARKPPYRAGGDAAKGSKFEDRPRRSSAGSADEKPRRSFGADRDEKPRRRSAGSEEERPRRASADRDEKPRRRTGSDEERPKRASADRDEKPRRRSAGSDERPARGAGEKSDRKAFGSFSGARGARANASKGKPAFGDKPRKSFGDADERRSSRKDKSGDEGIKRVKYDDFADGKVFSGAARRTDKKGKPAKKAAPVRKQNDDGTIRLNKYLSNAGVASRRDADTLIQSGVVKVNGVVIDQLGYKINPTDKVTYGDAAVRSERKVYLLLNKPKDYITTVDDPQERKTVMELIAKACKERIYPVGRLDRNTTGLLLFTNDGELTAKLMHPKFNIKKIYHVSLNKGLKPEDFKAITEGIELEDGVIKADDVAFVGEGKKEIGIEIHSGRNRIVRRIFEHLGYDVLKLDRVSFAGLTKKDLPRAKHRFLTAKEIAFLQMIG